MSILDLCGQLEQDLSFYKSSCSKGFVCVVGDYFVKCNKLILV